MRPYWDNGVARLYEADARAIPLADGSVHCVVTSPPYWGLRDYGLGDWQGGSPECGHERLAIHADTGSLQGSTDANDHAQEPWPNGVCGRCGATQAPAGIGLEATLAEHLDNLVSVFRELRRVLRDDGQIWLNYGDHYAGNPGNGRGGGSALGGGDPHLSGSDKAGAGLAPKQLMGLPWRVAFALQDDGWWLRSAIVWHKPNPMPESVRDRPTNAYEMIFLLSKRSAYFYDAEAIRTPSDGGNPMVGTSAKGFDPTDHRATWENTHKVTAANARNVWTIPTQGRPDAHFATFPDELPRRCILAGTSERGVCVECGAPWGRVVEASGGTIGKSWHDHTADAEKGQQAAYGGGVGNADLGDGKYQRETTGWRPTCDHDGDPVPATVLDPFVGSGTTLAVAQALGRRGIGLDLNPEYLDIAKRRIGAVPLPMF